jgi:surfactin synthase thioesterase subunit
VVRLLASRLCDVPYCVIGHSVGTWLAFETLSLARDVGLPMPLKARAAARAGAQEPHQGAAGS